MNAHDVVDEEEEECRVCRGEAEEGRPLYKPCKCSGSIGLTHQDCLESWLQVQRNSNGKCELCKTKFSFQPTYVPGTPERLPVLQVIEGLFHRAAAKWLPFLCRIVFAATVWLGIAPLATTYLYHSWMHRPIAIADRWKWDLLLSDLISGIIVTVILIVSFLSLMSFLDFLRGEWQQHGLVPRHLRNADMAQPAVPAAAVAPDDEDIDEGIWDKVQEQILSQTKRRNSKRLAAAAGEPGERQMQNVNNNNNVLGENANRNEQSNEPWNGYVQGAQDAYIIDSDGEEEDDEDWDPDLDIDEMDDDSALGGSDVDADSDVEADDDDDEQEDGPPENIPLNDFRNPNNNNNIPPADMNPPRLFDFNEDDGADMEVNIVLDELLGLRGPLRAVLGNLLWLLSFNAVFLGFFAFTPRVLGTAMNSIFFNSTIFFAVNASAAELPNITNPVSFSDFVQAIDIVSAQQKTTFRLPDLLVVGLGYVCCAAIALSLRLFWFIWNRLHRYVSFSQAGVSHDEIQDVRDALDEINRVMQAQALPQPPPNQFGAGAGQGPALGVAVGVGLDALMAMVKVGILLFLKMFSLPVFLGLCLDASAIAVFGGSLEDRINFAGSDLFSFLLLHWVAGITFMLLVTVSVLQLREVVHPDILSQVIRPQEPQPDLLGNLMHDTVATHAKRMTMSLIIYAVLLALLVYVPARLLLVHGKGFLPSFELHLSYILTPRLQIPLELLTFHFCMLGLLERFKNSIGDAQHYWLKLITRPLGLLEHILPQEVAHFARIARRPVFRERMELDDFWCTLAELEGDKEQFLSSALSSMDNSVESDLRDGITKATGERYLKDGADFIRLPVRLPGAALRNRSVLLPSKIGRYRLSRATFQNEDFIEVWHEVTGPPIPRPPEGWDDLGLGGADQQGRWAWNHEKKSAIEEGVARRQLIFRHQSAARKLQMGVKVFLLFFISWIAAAGFLFLAVLTPLALGRHMYRVFRIPDDWVHDPFAFFVGGLFCFPLAFVVGRVLAASDEPLLSRLFHWLSRFRMPPLQKLYVVLWSLALLLFVIPISVGVIYDVTFVKSTAWLTGKENWYDQESLLLDWIAGCTIMAPWSVLCYLGVLTREFWAVVADGNEGGGGEVGRNEADAQAAAWENAGGGRLRLKWQGRYGRVWRCWDILRAVWQDWEWDKVDAAILLHQSTIPFAFSALYVILAGTTTLVITNWQLGFLPVIAKAAFIRAMLISSAVIQLALCWKDQIHNWFEAAHNAARDERYLTGVILQNYQGD